VLLMEGRRFPHGAPKGKDVPPPDEAELKRRDQMRVAAPTTPGGVFFRALALGNDGQFSVGFADSWSPPPGASTRPSSDE
jgi:hypothetical protein